MRSASINRKSLWNSNKINRKSLLISAKKKDRKSDSFLKKKTKRTNIFDNILSNDRNRNKKEEEWRWRKGVVKPGGGAALLRRIFIKEERRSKKYWLKLGAGTGARGNDLVTQAAAERWRRWAAVFAKWGWWVVRWRWPRRGVVKAALGRRRS